MLKFYEARISGCNKYNKKKYYMAPHLNNFRVQWYFIRTIKYATLYFKLFLILEVFWTPSNTQALKNGNVWSKKWKFFWNRMRSEQEFRDIALFYVVLMTNKYPSINDFSLVGNSAVYSRCVYGKASHVRDFPHWVKCVLECHIF